MVVTEFTLWAARLGVLALMYLLVLILIFAMRADARAASLAPRPIAPPVPKPAPVPTPAPSQAPTTTPSTGVRTLVVTSGTIPNSGREYQLFGPVDIGRSADCIISVPNKFVSSRHARIFQENGIWIVEDLGSTNGTVLNGNPLLTPQRFKPGDKLMIGDTEFQLQ